MTPYTYVCANCGSKEVWVDATAVWSEAAQQWELLHTFDNSYCNDCDGETNLLTKGLL